MVDRGDREGGESAGFPVCGRLDCGDSISFRSPYVVSVTRSIYHLTRHHPFSYCHFTHYLTSDTYSQSDPTHIYPIQFFVITHIRHPELGK
jgi:hypothetical protein